MIRHALLNSLFIFFFAGSLAAQDSIFYLYPEDIRPGRVLKYQIHGDTVLYGYLNGGAELYYEYGFRKLYFEDVLMGRNLVRINVFEMKDSAAAFGIYSVSARNCQLRDSLGRNDCINWNQVLFAKGPYFATIAPLKPDSLARKNLVKIAAILEKRVREREFQPHPLFTIPILKPYRGEIRYAVGPLGLQNGFPDWEPMFEDIERFELTVLPVDKDKGHLDFGRVVFGSEKELEIFAANNKFIDAEKQGPVIRENQGEKLMFVRTGDNVALILGYRGEDSDLKVVWDQVLKISSK